jgi:hypothetical protein
MRLPTGSVLGATALFTALAVHAAACMPEVSLGNGGDAGASDGGLANPNPNPVTAPSAQGAGCIAETATGGALCAAISICPKVVFDRSSFPNCGYRIHGQVLDLECDCGGALCPIGVPLTCDQAAQLLQNQNQATICTQLNEGRCSGVAMTPGGTFPTPQTPVTAPPMPPTSTCDKACRDDCAGEPSCLTLCGC